MRRVPQARRVCLGLGFLFSANSRFLRESYLFLLHNLKHSTENLQLNTVLVLFLCELCVQRLPRSGRGALCVNLVFLFSELRNLKLKTYNFSNTGSADSGAAAGPSNSAIKIPATTKPAPHHARALNLSRSTTYDVTTANTGSSANKIAA
jgi:hypothetical protein